MRRNVRFSHQSHVNEPPSSTFKCSRYAGNHIKPSLDAHNFYYAKCAQGLLQVPSTSGGEAPSNFCYRSRKQANFTTTALN